MGLDCRRRRSRRLALAALALIALADRSEAQFVGPPGQVGMATPAGEWAEAEILTVTPKWLVLQNPQGQQFPVSLAANSVQLFLIRWPTTPDRLAPDAWIEASGGIGNSNQLLTDHVDVYQGPSKGFLPTARDPIQLLYNGLGDYLTPLDVFSDQRNVLGDDFRRQPENNFPTGMYVVGPVVGRNPLLVQILGNTRVSLVGPQGVPSMTLVTPGSSTLVRAGDLVRYHVVDASPRSLTLSELWVYKTVPIDQYAP
jgi:hypothetical protein